MTSHSYALLTAARNEEAYLPLTIESVLSQTELPKEWIIVSDASTDRTDEIVLRYAKQSRIIRLVRSFADHTRGFGAQVDAINLGHLNLCRSDYDFIGNLDADVSFDSKYFAELLRRFDANPKLGIAGGVIREKDGTTMSSPAGEILQSVPHALQLFRRACYEEVGGYVPMPFGGPDTYAEVRARMKGWQVRGFPDLVAQHHRYTGSANGLIRGRFQQGLMDFSLGYDPLFELFKCARRLREKPRAFGALIRFTGFLWGYLEIRSPRVPIDFVQYLRSEQRERMRSRARAWRLLSNII